MPIAMITTKPTTATSNSNSNNKKKEKKITFGNVTIIEFPVVLGDNPTTVTGVPVQLGDKPFSSKEYDIQSYEDSKRVAVVGQQQQQRSRKELILSPQERFKL